MATTAWDQLDGESPQAFRAFVIYRDQGSGRSLEATTAAIQGRQRGAGRASGRVYRWSAQHRWGERVRGYDGHMDGVRQRAREQAAVESVERWERVRDEQLEADLEIGRALIKQGRELAGFPVVTETVSRDGRSLTFQAADPRWLAVGAKVIETGHSMVWDTIERGLGVSRQQAGDLPDMFDQSTLDRAEARYAEWRAERLGRASGYSNPAGSPPRVLIERPGQRVERLGQAGVGASAFVERSGGCVVHRPGQAKP